MPELARPIKFGAASLCLALAAGVVATQSATGGTPAIHASAAAASTAKLPIKAIERIERADGTYSGGVLTIDLDRDALHHKLHGISLKPGFEIQHELFFQRLPGGGAAFNGELAVTTKEAQRTIAAIEANGLVFQAMHQHFLDIHPMMWFIHFRGTGSALGLAQRVHRVVEATHVHLPQSSPKHPKTTLPAATLGRILGGTPQVEAHGLVDVDIDRANAERLGGHHIEPGLGIDTTVEFQPIAGLGRAIVVPDFGMTAKEIGPVVRTMRASGWTVECLYNQETSEHPQLYFSHMVKAGNAVLLAQQIRAGLDRMDVEHKS